MDKLINHSTAKVEGKILCVEIPTLLYKMYCTFILEMTRGNSSNAKCVGQI